MITFVNIRSKVVFFSSKNVAQNLSDSKINKYMFSFTANLSSMQDRWGEK